MPISSELPTLPNYSHRGPPQSIDSRDTFDELPSASNVVSTPLLPFGFIPSAAPHLPFVSIKHDAQVPQKGTRPSASNNIQVLRNPIFPIYPYSPYYTITFPHANFYPPTVTNVKDNTQVPNTISTPIFHQPYFKTSGGNSNLKVLVAEIPTSLDLQWDVVPSLRDDIPPIPAGIAQSTQPKFSWQNFENSKHLKVSKSGDDSGVIKY